MDFSEYGTSNRERAQENDRIRIKRFEKNYCPVRQSKTYFHGYKGLFFYENKKACENVF